MRCMITTHSIVHSNGMLLVLLLPEARLCARALDGVFCFVMLCTQLRRLVRG